jgi:hypothetical protein
MRRRPGAELFLKRPRNATLQNARPVLRVHSALQLIRVLQLIVFQKHGAHGATALPNVQQMETVDRGRDRERSKRLHSSVVSLASYRKVAPVRAALTERQLRRPDASLPAQYAAHLRTLGSGRSGLLLPRRAACLSSPEPVQLLAQKETATFQKKTMRSFIDPHVIRQKHPHTATRIAFSANGPHGVSALFPAGVDNKAGRARWRRKPWNVVRSVNPTARNQGNAAPKNAVQKTAFPRSGSITGASAHTTAIRSADQVARWCDSDKYCPRQSAVASGASSNRRSRATFLVAWTV